MRIGSAERRTPTRCKWRAASTEDSGEFRSNG
uniref:Uncharacterized protein n=1 Tax=Arundo donax TaxID=35708 RepID=A0A0A9A0A6_ARUDO